MKNLFVLLAFFSVPAFAALPAASSLPWNEFTRDAVPTVNTKLLVTLHVGTRESEIRIPVTQCAQHIRAMLLKVTGADVSVKSFGIRFTDGQSKEFAVSETFKSGTDSGWIDLGILKRLDSRCPTTVFARGSSNGNALVRVYGDMQ
jgi:hypothetical protein